MSTVGVKTNRSFYLANNIKICYTYDDKSRVVKKTTVNLNDNSQAEEVYTYDNSGNIISDGTHAFVYGENNRLNAVNTDAHFSRPLQQMVDSGIIQLFPLG